MRAKQKLTTKRAARKGNILRRKNSTTPLGETFRLLPFHASENETPEKKQIAKQKIADLLVSGRGVPLTDDFLSYPTVYALLLEKVEILFSEKPDPLIVKSKPATGDDATIENVSVVNALLSSENAEFSRSTSESTTEAVVDLDNVANTSDVSDVNAKISMSQFGFFAFAYLMRLIFEGHLRYWQGLEITKSSDTFLHVDAASFDCKEAYGRFMQKKGKLVNIEFNSLVGMLAPHLSEEEVTFDNSSLVEYGELKFVPNVYWEFTFDPGVEAYKLVDEFSDGLRTEKKRIVVKKIDRHRQLRNSFLSFTFQNKDGVMFPRCNYSEYLNDSLPFDADFTDISKSLLPFDDRGKYYPFIEGLFYCFLLSHGVQTEKNTHFQFAYMPAFLSEISEIIQKKRAEVLKFFEVNVFFNKNEIDQCFQAISLEDLDDFIKQTVVFGELKAKDPCKEGLLVKSNKEIFKDECKNALYSWMSTTEPILNTDHGKKFKEVMRLWCGTKSKILSRVILKSVWPEKYGLIEDKNKLRKEWQKTTRGIDAFADAHGLALIPKKGTGSKKK